MLYDTENPIEENPMVAAAEEDAAGDVPANPLPTTPPTPAAPAWSKLFTAETGPGEIEDYVTHPLNPAHSTGLAQMLRGMTGLFGKSLRLALADIILGGARFVMERRAAAPAPAEGAAPNA